MGDVELQLLNDFQRGFPLVARPFEAVARLCHVTEQRVIDVLARLLAHGVVSRVGAVFAPGRIGASTLVALAAQPTRLAQVAATLSAFDGVNHSYEREHLFNLWAVVTAQDEAALRYLLARIESAVGSSLLDLRLVHEHRIDLGFDLTGKLQFEASPIARNGNRKVLSAEQRRLVAVLQEGIELVGEPYRALGSKAGLTEDRVLRILSEWSADGTVRRFGVIVRHHELGYRANAMAVWNVPDELALGIGDSIAMVPGVTLAYQRRRSPPQWPYNLFCMIHGKQRAAVIACLARMSDELGLERFAHAVLFSRQRFKQTGARYVPAEAMIAHG